MTTLTLSISDQLKKKMKKFTYINWSDVARTAILDKINLLEKMDRLLAKSDLSEEDSIKLGRSIKRRQWKKTKKNFALS